MDKTRLRLRIIRKLLKMKRELEQLIIDKEWWNENRRDVMPLDLGWERMLLQCVNEQLAAWDKNDLPAVNLWNSKANRIAANMPE